MVARKARFGQVWWLVKPGLDKHGSSPSQVWTSMVARKARFGQAWWLVKPGLDKHGGS